MEHRFYGISNAKDPAYGVAACLTYWVFKCRDRAKSPAMGIKTWTFLESSIQNAAQVSTDLEGYLQRLCDSLVSYMRPAELSKIIQPKQRILRVNEDMSEIKELNSDINLAFVGWRDLLDDIARDGFSEWDVLELCRSRASIIQVLCRLRYQEDEATGDDEPDDTLEVEAIHV